MHSWSALGSALQSRGLSAPLYLQFQVEISPTNLFLASKVINKPEIKSSVS
jgi:hypothetical protein